MTRAQLGAQWTVTLGGVPLQILANPEGVIKDVTPGYSGEYMAQTTDQAIVKRDAPIYIRRFSRGAGFVERRDDADDGGYAWAEDMLMHLENGAMPSGRRQNKGLDLGLGYGNFVSIVDAVFFLGSVWAITNHGKILKYTTDPSVTPAEHPPSGLPFNGGLTGFRPNFDAVAMAVFATAAGVPALYVAATDGANYRMYQYTASGGWTESAALGFSVTHMATCWWEGVDGVGAERLHVATDNSVMRHCISGQDPMTAASYISPITVGNPAYAIKSLVAAPAHLYVIKENGIHDFNELRSWNLTPYWQSSASSSQGAIALLYDDQILASRNAGLDRYDLNRNGAQQRLPGECMPMYAMQDGTPIRGYISGLAEHDGWVLATIYNPDNETTYLMRGKDRRTLGIDVPNPMVWHGAEQILRPDGGNSIRVSKMLVVPARAGAAPGDGASMLWMWVQFGAELGTWGVDLYYAPLPSGSGPLSLATSGGSFTFNPSASLVMTTQNWGDRNAIKHIRRYDFDGQKVSATSTVQLFVRPDGDPTTITNVATWATQGTFESNSDSLTPSPAVQGHALGLQVLLTTPSPYTSPPILRELSPRARVAREVFDVRTIWVVMEQDAELASGAPDLRSPDETMGSITPFQLTGPIAYVDQMGNTWSVIVEQGIRYVRIQTDDEHWRIVARVELSLVG